MLMMPLHLHINQKTDYDDDGWISHPVISSYRYDPIIQIVSWLSYFLKYYDRDEFNFCGFYQCVGSGESLAN